MWYWQRGRHIDQWKRAVNPQMDSHKYAQLTFHKGAKAIQQRKWSLLHMVMEQLDIYRQKHKP